MSAPLRLHVTVASLLNQARSIFVPPPSTSVFSGQILFVYTPISVSAGDMARRFCRGNVLVDDRIRVSALPEFHLNVRAQGEVVGVVCVGECRQFPLWFRFLLVRPLFLGLLPSCVTATPH